MANSAIIVAGGSGRRFGTKKQFLDLLGTSVIERAVSCFDSHPLIDSIVVVVPDEDIQTTRGALKDIKKPLTITRGGHNRQESVWNGLQSALKSDIVTIHDGVRPLVSRTLISSVIEGVKDFDACIPGLAVSNTIKVVKGDIVVRTISRANVYQIQTPQVFYTQTLIKAHESAQAGRHDQFTDDSALIEAIGGRVRIVKGDPYNIKITLKEDLQTAEALLRCHTELE